MKQFPLLLLTGLVLPLTAGEVYSSYAETPAASYAATPSVWRYFVGGSLGYLIDNEEIYGGLHAGIKIAETGALTHSLFVEGAYAEFSDTLKVDDLKIRTDAEAWVWSLNYKADVALGGGFSWYGGAGAGVGFVDTSAEFNFSNREVSDETTELVIQAFTGLGYDFTPNIEGFGGARFIWLDDFDDVGVELGARYKF